MKAVLIVILRYIGDVLLATPVLRGLRATYPDAYLAVAVNYGTDEILRGNTDLDDVMVVSRGNLAQELQFLRGIRRRRFDCVIDLTDGDRSAILTRMAGARVRVGFNDEHYWRGLLYTHVVRRDSNAMHRVNRNLETLRALDIDPKSPGLVLNISPEHEEEASRILSELRETQDGDGPLVMMHPGARFASKSWPAERFARVADLLSADGRCRILVGGDERERSLAEAVQARARTALTPLAGRTGLLTYAAVLKKCALFIGTDNGPMHMAAAVGTPVVALFGPTNPLQWGPCGEDVTALYKGVDCSGCRHPTCSRGEDSCMRSISVEEVVAAAQKYLGKVCARNG